MKVRRGSIVIAHGPWSNGHDEQAAIVTHVWGLERPGALVNLHVFTDLSDPLIVSEVPWYPSRESAMRALGDSHFDGGPRVCWTESEA